MQWSCKGSLIMAAWIFLATAILSEVLGTTVLKWADGLGKPLYTAATLVCYGLSFVFFSHALKGLSVVLVYAIWSGVGTALIALVGYWIFKEPLGWLKIVSLFLIVAGVVG